MRASHNPAINKLDNNITNGTYQNSGNPATWKGLGAKSIFLVMLAMISAMTTSVITNNALVAGNDTTLATLLIITGISALPLMIISFLVFAMPKLAPVLSSIYSICMGITLGVVTCIVDLAYPGIAVIAVLGTGTVFVVAIVVHRLLGGRLSNKFRRFVFIALISLVALQALSMLASLFFASFSAMYHGSFGLQLIVSSVCIVIATFTLLVDIDNMTRLVENGVGNEYEWTAAFGLVTSLLWLYVEILRLLVLVLGRNRN